MYELKISELFPCSAEQAYGITTSSFEGLEEHLLNVTRIKTLSREPHPGGCEKWMLELHAQAPIPRIAKPFFKQEMLHWREELVCNPTELEISWKVITKYFPEYVNCSGTTNYRDVENGSMISICGVFSLEPPPVPGISKSLTASVTGAMEQYMGKLIEPNIRQFYSAMMRVCEKRGCFYVPEVRPESEA